MNNPFDLIQREIKELEKSFGGKGYSELQINAIYQMASRVPLGYFSAVCENFVLNSRYKPLPIDFKNALSSYHQQKRQEEREPEQKITCDQCFDTGYCFVHNDAGLDDLVSRCICDKGVEMRKDFPRAIHRGQIKNFPIKKFTPGENGLEVVVQWWNGILAISKAYWDDKRKREG